MSLFHHPTDAIKPLIRTYRLISCRRISIKNGITGDNRPWLHTRSFTSTSINFQQSQENSNEEQTLVYSAPNAPTVKLLKMFSVTSLGVASLSAPAVFYFWETPAIQAADINGYMFIGALVASACSTGILHKFLSPYINNVILHQNRSKSIQTISPNTQVTLETFDLLARTKQTTVKLRDLIPAKSSWLTWNINKDAVLKREQLGKDKFPQTRFWLDQRGGIGDLETMSKIVKVVDEQYKRGRML
ncbi:hypothetical protein BGW37DRAFT_487850 [Umbelopsis sp. PMI_123]|nr:hypothetical protein BGW37DRAFT_487850 [Umbelopsis sp. PMI_123]